MKRILGSVRKLLDAGTLRRNSSEVATDHRKLNHRQVVNGSLLVAGGDTSTLFEPPDQLLHNTAAPIAGFVKLNHAVFAILVRLRWDDRDDLTFDQGFVDAIPSVPFVTCQSDRNDGFS